MYVASLPLPTLSICHAVLGTGFALPPPLATEQCFYISLIEV